MTNLELSRQIAAQGEQWIVAGCACQDPQSGHVYRRMEGGWVAHSGTLNSRDFFHDEERRWDAPQRALASGPLATDAASVGALRMTLPEQHRPTQYFTAWQIYTSADRFLDEPTAILAAFLAWQQAGAPC